MDFEKAIEVAMGCSIEKVRATPIGELPRGNWDLGDVNMDLSIGRLGHEISGEYVTHEGAEGMFNEVVGNTGFLVDMKKAYGAVMGYFGCGFKSQ